MKQIQIIAAMLLMHFAAGAQDVQVTETKESMGKAERWCFTAKYPFKKEVAAAAMEQNVERAGLERSSNKKGVSTYKGAVWTSISDSKCDYYYKMQGKKKYTTLYFSVSKGYDNYVTSSNDVSTSNNIKQYMLHLGEQMAAAVKIKEDEAELKKIAEKNAAAKAELEEAQKKQAEKEANLKALKGRQ